MIGNDLDRVLASHRLPTGQPSSLTTDDFDGFLAWRIEHLGEALAEKVETIGAAKNEIAPHHKRLDDRIEAIELRLRDIIGERLDSDGSLLPPHVSAKARERIQAAARKQPGPAGTQQELAGQLEYLDFRELQDSITTKQLWPRFESIFGTKETLISRFGQLAELRNAIRHSRTIGDVTIKDGEAALLWFEQVFVAFDRR